MARNWLSMNNGTNIESWAKQFVGHVKHYRIGNSGEWYPAYVDGYKLIPTAKFSVQFIVRNVHSYCNYEYCSYRCEKHIKPYGEQFIVTCGAGLIVRNRIRAIEQATQEGMLKQDKNGLILYPVELWAKQQLGHFDWTLINDVASEDDSIHHYYHHMIATSFVKFGDYIQFIGTCDNVDCHYSETKFVTPPHNTYF